MPNVLTISAPRRSESASSLLALFIIVTVFLICVSTHAVAQGGPWAVVTRGIEADKARQASCDKNPASDRCKEFTASLMLSWCDSLGPPTNLFNMGRCFGALSRYQTAGEMSRYLTDTDIALMEFRCLPDKLNNEQVRRIFIREGRKLPKEVLERPAPVLLYYALTKAFPCPLRAR